MTEHHSITTALAAAEAAPMSRKAAMLLALLLDAEIDRRFTTSGADDLLVYRAALAAQSSSLALVMNLAAMRDGGPRLVLEPVDIPPADYPALSEPDYMVSLYNNATVPRVLIALPGAERRDALETLRAAVAALGPER
jgi:hypothetical protein